MLQVVEYLKYRGLVPNLEEPPFAPTKSQNVDGYSICFFKNKDIKRGDTARAFEAARREAEDDQASLSDLARGFMGFCYKKWANKKIVIMVTTPSTPHACDHLEFTLSTVIATQLKSFCVIYMMWPSGSISL